MILRSSSLGLSNADSSSDFSAKGKRLQEIAFDFLDIRGEVDIDPLHAGLCPLDKCCTLLSERIDALFVFQSPAGGNEGNLQRRGRRLGAGGDHRVRTRLRREVPEGRGEDRRRRRRTPGVQLPGRALDPSAHDEPHRIYFRDSAFEEQGHQGAGLAGDRARDGVQAVEAAEARWRAVNAPHLLALVRAGAVFEKGKLNEQPVDSSTTKEAA
jgi:hypothetical protein